MNIKEPVKYYFGENCISENAKEFKSLGKKALIVTGHSSEKNGSLADVVEALSSMGIGHVVYNAIEENPSTEMIIKARDFGLDNACDFVVGIGGGSPMDAAKATSVMMKNSKYGEDFLYDSSYETTALPIALVATTCGSGAEVTPNAVLTTHKDKTKRSSVHRVFPNVAFVDYRYIEKAPIRLIRNTALDALTHMIESFVHAKADKYTKLFCINGMMLWGNCKDAILGKKELTGDVCKDLMLASSLGGFAIAHTGTSLPHRLSYSLTYNYGISHGLAVAYFIPTFLKYCDKKDVDVILSLIHFKSLGDFEKFISKIVGDIKVDDEVLNGAIDEIITNAKVRNSVKFTVDRKKLEKISKIS